MELEFLGYGSAFAPEFGNTCACFERDGDLFLLDCGETVYERLLRHRDLTAYGDIYVILTHLHADHVGSLGSLISYNYCVLGQKIHVVHPEETAVELLRLMGIKDEYYFYERIFDSKSRLDITPIPVRHVDNMKCYGYLVEEEGFCFYYSGDAAEVPKIIINRLLDGSLDRIYQDTTGHEKAGDNHCSLSSLEKMVPEKLRGRVFCMHLDEDTKKQLEKTGFQMALSLL